MRPVQVKAAVLHVKDLKHLKSWCPPLHYRVGQGFILHSPHRVRGSLHCARPGDYLVRLDGDAGLWAFMQPRHFRTLFRPREQVDAVDAPLSLGAALFAPFPRTG